MPIIVAPEEQPTTNIDQNNVIEHSSLHYKYACIDAAKYLSEIENFLIARDVEILRDKVQLISSKDNKKEIICESNTINATHVYDSRPPEIKEDSLKQHFYGIEIELESVSREPPSARSDS